MTENTRPGSGASGYVGVTLVTNRNRQWWQAALKHKSDPHWSIRADSPEVAAWLRDEEIRRRGVQDSHAMNNVGIPKCHTLGDFIRVYGEDKILSVLHDYYNEYNGH